MDTYFQLNPMVEMDPIKLVSIHIYGGAIYWWFHGMKTLGHDQVVTYEEFTRKLTKRFDRRDPDISFWDLQHIRQVGNIEEYISELQKMDVMAIDISESRPILLFIEGLAEPLKGLVKAYRHTTLQEAVSRTRDLHNVIPRTKYPRRPLIPHKFQNQRPPVRIFPTPVLQLQPFPQNFQF